MQRMDTKSYQNVNILEKKTVTIIPFILIEKSLNGVTEKKTKKRFQKWSRFWITSHMSGLKGFSSWCMNSQTYTDGNTWKMRFTESTGPVWTCWNTFMHKHTLQPVRCFHTHFLNSSSDSAHMFLTLTFLWDGDQVCPLDLQCVCVFLCRIDFCFTTDLSVLSECRTITNLSDTHTHNTQTHASLKSQRVFNG